MDSTTPQDASTVLDSALTDTRPIPLGRLSTAETLNRLRPDGKRVAVAGFNSSL